MAEVSEESVLGALESAFGDAPTPKPAQAPVAPAKAVAEPVAEAAEEESAPVAEEAQEGEEGEPVAEEEATEEQAEVEPEFEIEVAGRRELVRGKEQIKELLQKGLDYSRKAEVVARESEVLATKMQALQLQEQAQTQLYEDITTLRSIDANLEHYNRINWSEEFDKDPFNAMKLKEQRDQLREVRNQKVAELQQKHSAIQQGQAQAAQAALRAETEALLAKLPQWRNSEQAAKEKSSLARYLVEAGFQENEVASLMDHRALLITRKAWLYDQLQANKDAKVKQLREAPTMSKPGAAPQQQKTNQKAAFAKFRGELRAQGKKGNYRAQENMLLDVLGRTFK